MGPKATFMLIALVLFAPLAGFAQHITDDAGKTYYDEEQTILKEVFSYKQVTVMNPRTSEGVKKRKVRHGPYFFYYRDGDIKVAGRYKDGEKHGKWEHYKANGTLKKVVKYKSGKQVNLNKDPEQPGDKPKDREAPEEEMEGS